MFPRSAYILLPWGKQFVMAIYTGPLRYFRRNDVCSFYEVEGQVRVRVKNPLSRKTVLKSPGFKNTRKYAGWMARGSRIGSEVYQSLPEDFRQFWMYRAFVGEAMQLLKSGMTDEDCLAHLRKVYVEVDYVRPAGKTSVQEKIKKEQPAQKEALPKKPKGTAVGQWLFSFRRNGSMLRKAECISAFEYDLYHIIAARAA